MWFHILSQLSSVHIHTSARCHHTVHSWGKGGALFILRHHSTLLSPPFQAHTQPLPGDSRGQGLPQELKGLVSGPVWPGSCWESPAPPQLGTAEPHCLPPSCGGGLGCQEGEEAAFVKRYCFARGKVLLKATSPISWGSWTQSPGGQNRTRVCSGLPHKPWF